MTHSSSFNKLTVYAVALTGAVVASPLCLEGAQEGFSGEVRSGVPFEQYGSQCATTLGGQENHNASAMISNGATHESPFDVIERSFSGIMRVERGVAYIPVEIPSFQVIDAALKIDAALRKLGAAPHYCTATRGGGVVLKYATVGYFFEVYVQNDGELILDSTISGGHNLESYLEWRSSIDEVKGELAKHCNHIGL